MTGDGAKRRRLDAAGDAATAARQGIRDALVSSVRADLDTIAGDVASLYMRAYEDTIQQARDDLQRHMNEVNSMKAWCDEVRERYSAEVTEAAARGKQETAEAVLAAEAERDAARAEADAARATVADLQRDLAEARQLAETYKETHDRIQSLLSGTGPRPM